MPFGNIGTDKAVIKNFIFLPIHGTVVIVSRSLVITGSFKYPVLVQTLQGYAGSYGIIEIQIISAGYSA